MSFTTLIDVAALRQLAAAGGDAAQAPALVLLDCRFDLAAPAAGRQAYMSAHIPTARYADLNLDLAAPVTNSSGRHPLPPPEILAARFASFGIRRTTQVVAYDAANGAFAARAWWLLRWLGHTEVAVLDGGYQAWVAQHGAVESGDLPGGAAHSLPGEAPVGLAHTAAAAATTHLPAVADTEAVASAADVLLALSDSARLLVDARAAERFAGTVEPIDPVAGHVGGAVNHPFADNLGPDGRFLPPPDLRERWLKRLDGRRPQDAILMCGSGVTACHNLLALEIAGLPGAKLFAGSWSEWIRDVRRPVARGADT